MADDFNNSGVTATAGLSPLQFPRTIDEMRAAARERFKERVQHGGLGTGCECHDETASSVPAGDSNEPHPCVAGVRFIDSGQVYYFDACELQVKLNDWVVVESNRGKEAARVVIAPSNVAMSQINGDLKPILRILNSHDIDTMERMRKESAHAVRALSARIREHRLQMKPISAEYNFDGSAVILNFSAPERIDFRELARDMAGILKCRVELRQVGPRDEARLLGGVGKCGRTLCCATWLPMFPEINMGMAKTQDLSLNPGKVSGVCGRLLCCLSYENEQYRQMKAVMPKLGQTVVTPRGDGIVIALQILKDVVTVQLQNEPAEAQFAAVELGFDAGAARREKPQFVQPPQVAQVAEVAEVADVAAVPEPEPEPPAVTESQEEAGEVQATQPGGRKRRRRRRGKNTAKQPE